MNSNMSAKERVINILNKMLVLLNDNSNNQDYINYLRYSLELITNANDDEINETIESLRIHPKSDLANISVYKGGVFQKEETDQHDKLSRELDEECFRAIVTSRGGQY